MRLELPRAAFLGAVWSCVVLQAQGPPPLRLAPGAQVETPVLARAVQGLRNSSAAPEAAKSEAAKLAAEAQSGDARRKLTRAWALLNNRAWDAREELIWSLALRPDRVVADPALPLTGSLTQFYHAPGSRLRVRLALSPGERELAAMDVPPRDLTDDPLRFEASLDGVADGRYTLAAEILDGAVAIARLDRPLVVVSGIETQRTAVERRLAKVQGHESAKATVRWPYDMARALNLGVRKLDGGDFGLREDGTSAFDFAKELRDSQQVLKALESGKDPLYRAKGDNERHYWFAEAGEIMPYRLYVPAKWDGKSKLKMLFVLHGNSRDHDFYFDRDNRILPKLAEQYGWLVVCPMGYRPSAGYNASNLRNVPGAPVPAAGVREFAGRGFDPARQRQTELSEKDAMNVFDLVTSEYPVDLSRVYLFGHSAGGTGGWYIAAKYPEKFAGIALSAFNTRPETYPFERIKGKAIMVIVGTKDSPNVVANVRAMAKALKEKGYEHRFLEKQDATHDNIVGLAEPEVFSFFDKHSRN